MKKNLFITLLLLLIAVFGFACTTANGSDTFMTLSINPEVGLFVDENKTITEVIALNNDADVLLDSTDIVGEDVETATEIIVSESVNAGFINIDTEGTEVVIDVQNEDEEKVKEIKEKITKSINEFFVNKGIFGKVSEDTLDKYAAAAEALGLSKGQTKMILLAFELNPELTIDDVKELSISELVKLCHKNAKEHNYGHELNVKFKADRIALKEKYAEMFTLSNEIAVIDEKLADPTLTEEEITALNSQKSKLEAKFDELKALYDEELKALRDAYKAEKESMKESLKKVKEEKEAKVKEKNEKHEKDFQKNQDKNNIKEKIKEFQNK